MPASLPFTNKSGVLLSRACHSINVIFPERTFAELAGPMLMGRLPLSFCLYLLFCLPNLSHDVRPRQQTFLREIIRSIRHLFNSRVFLIFGMAFLRKQKRAAAVSGFCCVPLDSSNSASSRQSGGRGCPTPVHGLLLSRRSRPGIMLTP